MNHQIQDEAYTEACKEIDALKERIAEILSLLHDEELIRLRRRAHKKVNISLANLFEAALANREHEATLRTRP